MTVFSRLFNYLLGKRKPAVPVYYSSTPTAVNGTYVVSAGAKIVKG